MKYLGAAYWIEQGADPHRSARQPMIFALILFEIGLWQNRTRFVL